MAELKYRTYDQLLSTVLEDLSLYDDNGLIKPLRYIKTARKCNATLGLKLNKQEERNIDVCNYKADIPDNLLTIRGLVCCPSDGSEYRFPCPTRRCLPSFAPYSINRNSLSTYQVDVDDNQLVFNFKDGSGKLSYTCQMEDEDGNLLVLDHDLTNDYYEWALKEKIFQDLWHNNDADVQQKLADARVQLPIARQIAENITSAPEYRVWREYNQKREREYYDKWVKMFNT